MAAEQEQPIAGYRNRVLPEGHVVETPSLQERQITMFNRVLDKIS
jgi:hypothetical protein